MSMNIIPLRSLWTPACHHNGIGVCPSFKAWLSADDFYIDNLHSAKNFTLSVRSNETLQSALASDAVRYGINALQTVHSIRSSNEFPKLNSWHLIKAYYAAFFAAHSTLRQFGMPFSNLQPGHTKQIANRAKIENSINIGPLASGNFLICYDPNARTIAFNQKDDSHKDLWTSYAKLLDAKATDILLQRGVQDDLVRISSHFTEISELLKFDGRYGSSN